MQEVPGTLGAIPKRVVARIASIEVLAGITELADILGLDLFSLMVFTGLWTANTEHLLDPVRYATIFDLPPNAERRPITRPALAERLRLPLETASAWVDALIALDLVEEGQGGLIVPSAVFTRKDMLDGIDLTYARMQRLVAVLAAFGMHPSADATSPARLAAGGEG